MPTTDLPGLLAAFLASTAGIALKAALTAAFVDFLTGSLAAMRDGTFATDALAAFLRRHILGRVGPLAVLLFAGYLTSDGVLTTFAAAGLTAYAAETIGSVKGNLQPPKDSVPATAAEAIAQGINPVPTD